MFVCLLSAPAFADDIDDCYNLADKNGPDLVIAACTRFIDQATSNSSKAMAFSDRGQAYRKKGNYEAAIADLDKAIHLAPKDAVHYHIRAILFFESGDLDRALANWDQAIALEPTEPNYYNHRAKIWSAKGDSERARADYAKAMELEAKK